MRLPEKKRLRRRLAVLTHLPPAPVRTMLTANLLHRDGNGFRSMPASQRLPWAKLQERRDGTTRGEVRVCDGVSQLKTFRKIQFFSVSVSVSLC